MIIGPKFGNSSIFMGEVTITSILSGFDQKSHFFERCSWFKFNNFRLALGMAFKLYTNVVKGLKLKSRTFWRLISTLVEVKREKLVGGLFVPTILNRVNGLSNNERTESDTFHCSFFNMGTKS